MTRAETFRLLCDVGIIPVVRAKTSEVLADVAKALLLGGVPVVEVTMTVPGAIDGIRRLAAEWGDRMRIGVGSVTAPEQAEAAIAAGAEFVVSPVTVPEVIEAAHRHDKVAIPGAFTPTEIYRAWQLGADVVKVFPATVGGPGYLKAVRAPMPHLNLMPTGGVDLETAGAFLKAGAVTLGVGTALVDTKAVEAGDWARITDLARQFREEVRKARA